MVEASSCCTVAVAVVDRPPAPTRGIASGRFTALLRSLADQWERARVIRELRRLGDHHLQDIGIARADIEGIADAMIRRRQR